MKTYSLVAAAALAIVASGSVLAEGSSYDYPQRIEAGKSRAEVVAELQQARANGTLRTTEADFQKETPLVASRSRADVRAETLAAIQAGDIRETTEDSNAFTIVLANGPAVAITR